MEAGGASRFRWPLLSMWIWPQATIRSLIVRRAPVATLALAALAGIYVTILLAAFVAPGIGVWVHPAVLAVIGALAGVAGLYVAAALIYAIGRLLGGTATYPELRRALAWTAIPTSLALTPFAVIGLSLFVLGVLISPSNRADDAGLGVFALMLLATPLGWWGLFVSVRAIGAVQNFGVVRSVLTLLLASGALWYAVNLLGQELGPRLPSFVMPNDAMLPALAPFERFRVGSSAEPQRGDIIIFARMRHHPDYGIITDHYVKRVIGLPGDRIATGGGVLSVNGEAVKRERQGDFVTTGKDGQQRSVARFRETLPNGVSYSVLDSDANRWLGDANYQVPPNYCFVLGDNRDNTDDSRDDYLDTVVSSTTPAHSDFVRLDRMHGKALIDRAR